MATQIERRGIKACSWDNIAAMISMRRWLFLVLAWCIACGGSQHPKMPRLKPGWYVVQFTGARLDARRANGEPWHTSSSDSSSTIVGGLVGLAIGYPALGLALGEAASTPGGDPLAPAPFIDLKIESETYRVSDVGRTYAPAWQQPIAIDARRRRGDEHVIIQIRDAVDSSSISQYEMTLAELLAKPTQTLTALGAVMSLDVTVAPMASRAPVEYQLRIPADVGFKDLARKGHPGWRPVPVWNGDTVMVEAGGAVCPSSRHECFDPGGADPGRWSNYSYLKDVPHASLVAAAPGKALAIGLHRVFQVTQAGSVLLFVNDEDVGNNSGAFEAHVVVTPPR